MEPGAYVPADDLKAVRGSSEDVARLIGRMPEEVQALIESKPGRGGGRRLVSPIEIVPYSTARLIEWLSGPPMALDSPTIRPCLIRTHGPTLPPQPQWWWQMLSTRELLEILREANPGADLTENDIRSALRWGKVPAPALFAGRLAWSIEEARRLAQCLKVSLPEHPFRRSQSV